MHTFRMLETDDARKVAEGTLQSFNALICCLGLQGIDLSQLLDDLEMYRAIASPSTGPVADENLSRSVLALRRTVPDEPQKNG